MKTSKKDSNAWCDNDGGILVPVENISSFPVSAHFHFGTDHPNNGSYQANGYHPDHNGMLYFSNVPCSPSGRLDFIFTFQNEAFVFLDGKYCETCPDPADFSSADCPTMADCSLDLLSFIDQNQFEILCKQWMVDCNTTSPIYRVGKVGIGTANPLAELTVKEGIITDRALVEACDKLEWCDYVFDPDYPLMPLKELEAFINEKRHLPGTPSAKKIEEAGGFELLAVTTNQQEKIEEIFLHLIRLQKQADQLNEKIRRLKTENQQLKHSDNTF